MRLVKGWPEITSTHLSEANRGRYSGPQHLSLVSGTRTLQLHEFRVHVSGLAMSRNSGERRAFTPRTVSFGPDPGNAHWIRQVSMLDRASNEAQITLPGTGQSSIGPTPCRRLIARGSTAR